MDVLSRSGVATRTLHFPEDDHRLSSIEAEAEVFANTALWFRHYVTHIPE